MSEDQLRELLGEAAGLPGRPPFEALTASLHRRRRNRLLRRGGTTALAAAVALVLTAGGFGGAAHPGRTGPANGHVAGPGAGLELAADLTAYPSCAVLLADLQKRADGLVGPYGLSSGMGGFQLGMRGGPLDALGPQSRAAALPAASAAAGGQDTAEGLSSASDGLAHSSTTDRTRGVDEPDVTKTDGRLFLSLRQGTLRVYDAVHPALLGSVQLRASTFDGYGSDGSGLLFFGRTAVVTGLRPLTQQSGDTRGSSIVDAVDLTDPSHPVVTRRLTVDGDVVDARLVNGVPRLITHAGPPALRWFTSTDGTAASMAEATDRNRALLHQSVITDWLPTYALADGAGRDLGHGQLFACNAVVRDTAPTDGADIVGVTAFDASAPGALTGGLGVVGAGDTAYAAGTHLWIATGHGGGGFRGCAYCRTFDVAPAAAGSGARTQLHGFDIADPSHTGSLGSVTLPGGLHGDDAVNESDGVLSVVLSHGGPEPGMGPQSSTLVDLRLAAGGLTRIGELPDLGAGETVQSVRWIGAFCYLVTFRAVDPLLVIDTSRPEAPRLRASLPSADTSTYLLQSDTSRLLGVGNSGRGTVAKLYGVDDPDHPVLLATASVPGGGTPAAGDPHALLYWRAGRLLFLPTYDKGVRVLTVGRDGVTPRFALSHTGRPGHGDTQPDRAVLIGHNAWTVSARGVLVSDLAGGGDVSWLPTP